jgi:hypothetical protein
VVRRLFGIDETRSSTIDADLLVIAQKIILDGRPRVCLLDGAEILSQGTVGELRQHLGKIYSLIQDNGSGDARLAFVAASRRDGGWQGVVPYPAPAILQLDKLTPEIMQEALERLAQRMTGVHYPKELRRDARLVQRFTDGVPKLFQDSLRWIEAEQWLELDRLGDRQLFEKIVSPYVRDELLAPGSLFPEEEAQLRESKTQFAALLDAIRILVPYRFFTQYHLNRGMAIDFSFKNNLKNADWTIGRLWQAIGDTALLKRPFADAWYEVHPAIRRLLFEYFYHENRQADAHREAREVSAQWADMLSGKDQINGMVEAIWHQAAYLRLSGGGMLERHLTEFAGQLSRTIRPHAYTESELRDYAAQRMRNDDELRNEIADFDGLFDRLVWYFLTHMAGS